MNELPVRRRPTLRWRLVLLTGVLLIVSAVTSTVLALILAGATRTTFVLAILCTLLIAGTGVTGCYLVAARALRPLHQVTAAARRLGNGGPEQRLGHLGPDDEVKELADAFDAMLDQLSAALNSQRRFVANASHELRTPLAVMRTEIDVTLADEDAAIEEYRQMGTVVRNASVRANDLIESLLLLARTEAQTGRGLVKQVPVDLALGVPSTLSAVDTEIRRLGLIVTKDLTSAPVVGDPSLLERLAGNLIENAVRYNVADGAMEVSTGQAGAWSYLTVSNTGQLLDPAEVPGLFEPFRRGGMERTGTRGAGLGLSIVRAVVDAHNGNVTADARPGGGLTVTVQLATKSAKGAS